MADKMEIVRCQYCYGYFSVPELRQHLKDGCLAKIMYNDYFRKPIQWDRLSRSPHRG